MNDPVLAYLLCDPNFAGIQEIYDFIDDGRDIIRI
jgi:hypothetical protein